MLLGKLFESDLNYVKHDVDQVYSVYDVDSLFLRNENFENNKFETIVVDNQIHCALHNRGTVDNKMSTH